MCGTPLSVRTLEVGSYLVLIRKDGYRDVRYPIRVDYGSRIDGRVRLYTEEDIGKGFVQIPQGLFLMGDDSRASLDAEKRRWIDIETDYFMARHEVTFGQYVQFLNTLSKEEGLRRAPRTNEPQENQQPTYYVQFDGNRFRVWSGHDPGLFLILS